MRQFVAGFILLCLGLICQSQAGFQTLLKAGRPPVSANSAAFTNFLARSTALDATHQTRYQTLLDGLTTDGFFDGAGVSTKLSALYIFATQSNGTRANAKLNLVSSSFPVVEHGTVTFTADVGYTGNGTDFYLDTQFTPSSSGGSIYTLNSASYGVYNLTNNNESKSMMGIFNESNSFLETFVAGANYGVNGGGVATGAPTTVAGFYGAVRTASNAEQLYYNASTTFDTSTNASEALNTAPIIIFARGPAPDSFSNKQMSAAFIGTGLSGADWALLSARVNTYMAAYGISLY